MQRMTTDVFIETEPRMDNVVAVKVVDEKLYFLGWMETAEHYSIQMAANSTGYLLDNTYIIETGDIFEAVCTTEEYNHMNVLYEMDDDGNLINEREKKYRNAHECFLDALNEPDIHIFALTDKELSNICNVLRDGSYIFSVNTIRNN